MPTIPGIPGPYRFFIYSFDCNEPMHVHVQRDNDTCKFWLEPLSLASSHGFGAVELNRIRKAIRSNLTVIKDAWSKHCGSA